MQEFSNQEVFEIAKKQKAIIWLIIVSFAVFFFPLAWIVVAIVNLVFVYQLAKALKLGGAWAWCVAQIIPLVSLITLLVLNSKATAAIRSKGVTVGLLGARKSELAKLGVPAA